MAVLILCCCMQAFSSCGEWELLPHCGAQASHCGDLTQSMWNFPRPGIEPISLGLAGGFLPTVPPGKSQGCLYWPFTEN